MASQLTHTAFVHQYAAEKKISHEDANSKVWAEGLYDAYLAAEVKKKQQSTCEDCARNDVDVFKYHCGDFCGESWCRNFKIYLCDSCAREREQ
jgi:hypothetical protein